MALLHQLVAWIVATVSQFGYLGIVIMMFLESSFFPFPSEVVMVPAGYLAFKGEMSLGVALIMGIIGSILGGVFNYLLALWLGRPFFHKWGKYILISEDKITKVEKFFARHGEIGTFTGRLIPVVRQYISFPAGLARMKMSLFILYTSLGAGLWCSILLAIGYIAGRNEVLIKAYVNTAVIWMLVFSACLIGIYSLIYLRRKANI
ncbi:MAG: DedA family protein [Nitrospinae bacterium]|nr:DedA family protein [Nitrospinota bacterium]